MREKEQKRRIDKDEEGARMHHFVGFLLGALSLLEPTQLSKYYTEITTPCSILPENIYKKEKKKS